MADLKHRFLSHDIHTPLESIRVIFNNSCYLTAVSIYPLPGIVKHIWAAVAAAPINVCAWMDFEKHVGYNDDNQSASLSILVSPEKKTVSVAVWASGMPVRLRRQ